MPLSDIAGEYISKAKLTQQSELPGVIFDVGFISMPSQYDIGAHGADSVAPDVTTPAFISVCIALLIEIPLFAAFSVRGAESFARYLSNSDEVAKIAAMMWKSIDWCYIFYALATLLATILLATKTKW